jgi:hypothetical protein
MPCHGKNFYPYPLFGLLQTHWEYHTPWVPEPPTKDLKAITMLSNQEEADAGRGLLDVPNNLKYPNTLLPVI